MAKTTKKTTKTVARSTPTRKPRPRTKEIILTPEERRRMIAEAAYLRAQNRNFNGGNPEQDWLEAEAEINWMYASAQ